MYKQTSGFGDPHCSNGPEERPTYAPWEPFQKAVPIRAAQGHVACMMYPRAASELQKLQLEDEPY